MYVANFGAGTVSVIDSATNSVIDTISTGQGTQWLEDDSRNGNLYVTNSLQGTGSVISSAP
jgi:YVTN family beta-propeller protein